MYGECLLCPLYPLLNETNRGRPDSTCVWTSLSFFHCACVQTSLFFPLRMCFRPRAFRRLFFPLRIRTDVSFFPLSMPSDVSLFISAAHAFRVSLFFSVAHPFRHLLFSAAHAFRRISVHFRCACVQTSQFFFRCASVQSSRCYETQRKKAGGAPSGGDA